MVKANFTHENNDGVLELITHFNELIKIPINKTSDEIFRLGGTAINSVLVVEGILLSEDFKSPVKFRGFKNNESFDAIGILSPEKWYASDRHCFATEYYDLYMEGNRPEWFISKQPIINPMHLFINLDIIDGGGNILTRYRVSPFTGKYRIMEQL